MSRTIYLLTIDAIHMTGCQGNERRNVPAGARWPRRRPAARSCVPPGGCSPRTASPARRCSRSPRSQAWRCRPSTRASAPRPRWSWPSTTSSTRRPTSPGSPPRSAQETEPAQLIAKGVHLTRQLNERCGDVIQVLLSAAPAEPDAAAVVADGMRRHDTAPASSAQRLAALGALRAGRRRSGPPPCSR